MGWRQTGQLHPPRPIQVHTCDQCGRDIGKPNGYDSIFPYFEIVAKYRDPGHAEDDTAMVAYSLCTLACLVTMSRRLESGERPALEG